MSINIGITANTNPISQPIVQVKPQPRNCFNLILFFIEHLSDKYQPIYHHDI